MKLQRLPRIGLVAIALALAACTTQTGQDTPTTTSSPAAPTTVATVRSDFPASGPVEAGTYHIPASAWSVADLTLTMPDGWENQGAPYAFKPSDSDGEVGFYFVTVDTIYTDPCVGSAGETDNLTEVGPTVDDLAQALLDQPYTVAAGPVDTTLGGLPAQRIDLTMADDPETATCNINVPGHLQIWYSQPTDAYFVLLGDGTASVYILDVNGERQVFLTQHQAGTTPEDIAEMQTIIESIKIDT